MSSALPGAFYNRLSCLTTYNRCLYGESTTSGKAVFGNSYLKRSVKILFCTAIGNSGHSLNQECAIITIYLKGVSDGEKNRLEMERETMDCITKARQKFVLAFQCCWNGNDFPVFRDIRVSENEGMHTGFLAIDLLDEALDLYPKFQEARNLRGDIWHAILTNNREDHYEKYLHSNAWAEIREKCFAYFGDQCLFCDNDAKEVHHRNYANIGKENVQMDLSPLCNECHNRFHETRNPDSENNPLGREYWDQFKTYVEGKGNKLQLFPKPDLPSFYGIQIDPRTRTSKDIYKAGAFWLIAYRDTNELQAKLCMRSDAHYRFLKGQKEKIEREFDDNLGVFRWGDDRRRIGFLNNTVGHVDEANREEEFSWLHDRLIRLHKVFHTRVSELQSR